MDKKKIKINRIYLLIAAAFVSIAVFFVFWLLTFSRFFLIEYIAVETNGIDESLVRSAVFTYTDGSNGMFRRNNLIIFNQDEAAVILNDMFQVERLSIKKRYPSTVEISIDAKPFRFIAYGGGTFYDVTTRGTIAREIDPESIEFYPSFILSYQHRGRAVFAKPLEKQLPAIPLIYVDDPSLLSDHGKPVFASDRIEQIREMKRLMDSSKMKAIFFRMNGQEPEYSVMTKYGWEVRLSALASPQEQFDRLVTLFDKKLKARKRDIEYVDMRFGNKVYYRFQ